MMPSPHDVFIVEEALPPRRAITCTTTSSNRRKKGQRQKRKTGTILLVTIKVVVLVVVLLLQVSCSSGVESWETNIPATTIDNKKSTTITASNSSTATTITTSSTRRRRAADTTGQRLKLGCFDAKQLSCDAQPLLQDVRPLETDFRLTNVCMRIALEVFSGFGHVVFEVDQHATFLNKIDSSTEFCHQIAVAYRYCRFCHPDPEDLCFRQSNRQKCGGQASRQDILSNATKYPWFQTDADIDRTCEDIQVMKNTIWAVQWDSPYASTVELCDRQAAVGHLCPGECDGGCFDPDVFPLTCDPTAYDRYVNNLVAQDPTTNVTALYNPEQDPSTICFRIAREAFLYVGADVVLNVSEHLHYLDLYPGNSTDCQLIRQAYAQCVWCTNQFCFNDDHPATCDPPPSLLLEEDSTTEVALLPLQGYDFDDTHPELAETFDMCLYLYFNFVQKDANIIFNTTRENNALHQLVPENSAQCNASRQFYHKCVWCVRHYQPPEQQQNDVARNDYSHYGSFCYPEFACSNNWTIPDEFITHIQDRLNMTLDDDDHPTPESYCDELFAYRRNGTSPYQFVLEGCFEDIYLARLCPHLFCPDTINLGEVSYLGASTTQQKQALIWVSRAAAILSFLGAGFIVVDIVTNPKARATVFHQLLIGMASFDMVTAVSWSFATAAIDEDDPYARFIEGAAGNHATCIAQAFFIQLGFTSMFYNVSLASYYVLVIAYGWREFQLKKIAMYMHLVPLVSGLGLAFGGITSYGIIGYGCHFTPPPDGEAWPIYVFVVVPLGIAIAAITLAMVLVYCKVRQQAAKSRKWSLGISSAGAMEKAVFWQCLYYVAAFYITWPIMFAVYIAGVENREMLGLSITVAFVAPLQGFSNFCVYLRPKLMRRFGASDFAKKKGKMKSQLRFNLQRFSTMASTTSRVSRFGRASTATSSSNQENSTINRRPSFDYLDPSAVLAQESYHNQRGEERADSYKTRGSTKAHSVEEGLATVDEVSSVERAARENSRSVAGAATLLGAPVMLEDDEDSVRSFLDGDSDDEINSKELADDDCSDETADSKQAPDSNNRSDANNDLDDNDDPNQEDGPAGKQDEDDVTAIETAASDGSNSHCESGTGRRTAVGAGTTRGTLLSVPTHADADQYDSDESTDGTAPISAHRKADIGHHSSGSLGRENGSRVKESLDKEAQEHCPDRINDTSSSASYQNESDDIQSRGSPHNSSENFESELAYPSSRSKKDYSKYLRSTR